MGISWIQSIRAEHSMKIFVVLSAVVAATYAEADADAGILGLGLYGYGYGYGLKSAPCVNAANVPVPCAGVHLIGKREAEADPKADAGYLEYLGGYYGGYYPGYFGGYGHLIGKREAEAEPKADAGYLGHLGGYYYPGYFGGYFGGY